MNLSDDDKQLLQELCVTHDIDFAKVIKLLQTVREYEFKDRRTGIYDALKEIIKNDNMNKGVTN